MSINQNFLLKIIQKWQIGQIENDFIKISFYKGNNFYWIVKYVHLINIAEINIMKSPNDNSKG